MASLATEKTQLEIDIDDNAAAIAIWPWTVNGVPTRKDNMDIDEYTRRLLAAKIEKGQPGEIRRCDEAYGDFGCPNNSRFWRSTTTSVSRPVPCGWVNGSGMPDFVSCPLCHVRSLDDGATSYEDLSVFDAGRVDTNVSDGCTGGTSSNFGKAMHPSTWRHPTEEVKKLSAPSSKVENTLEDHAKKLFGVNITPEQMEALQKEIREDKKRKREQESNKRADAADKRKKTGGRRTRTKSRKKSRRRKRRKKRTRRKKRRNKRRSKSRRRKN